MRKHIGKEIKVKAAGGIASLLLITMSISSAPFARASFVSNTFTAVVL